MSAEEFSVCIKSCVTGEPHLIELDFVAVSFFDARGVREVHRALCFIRKSGRDVVITSPSAMVYKVLLFAGLTDDRTHRKRKRSPACLLSTSTPPPRRSHP